MKNKKIIVLSALASTIAMSVSANTVLQQVSAYMNHSVQYTFNGEKILEGQGALIYKDSTYVPLRAISEALGVDVVFEDGVIKLSESQNISSSSNNSVTSIQQGFEYKNMIVVDVDLENNSFIIAQSESADVSEHIIVRLTPETSIRDEKNKALYKFEDISTNQIVSVKTTGIATKSLPVQVIATDVVISSESEKIKEHAIPEAIFNNYPTLKDTDFKNMEIVKLDLENQKIVMVPVGSDKESIENQVVVHLSNETTFAHYKNKAIYTLNDIEIGQVICVRSTGISTMSIPQQISAANIVLVD